MLSLQLPGPLPPPSAVGLATQVPAGHTAGLVGTFIVQEGKTSGEDQFSNALLNLGQRLTQPKATLLERPILPPDVWLEDQYYSGPLKKEFWPQKRKDFIAAAQGDITEVILTGAIGIGKSAILKALAMYDLYRLSCFMEPQRVLGIGSAEFLVMVLVSLNMTKSKDKLLNPLRNAIELTPYFKKEFPYDKRKESVLEFPKGIVIKPGVTGESAVHSEDVIWIGVSECVVGETGVTLANFNTVRIDSLVGQAFDTMAWTGQHFQSRRAVCKLIGVRPAWKIWFVDGSSLGCTKAHEILTPFGYRHTADLREGDHVVQRKALRGDQSTDAGGATEAPRGRGWGLRGDDCQAAGGEGEYQRGDQGEDACCTAGALSRSCTASAHLRASEGNLPDRRGQGQKLGCPSTAVGQARVPSPCAGTQGIVEAPPQRRALSKDLREQPTSSWHDPLVRGDQGQLLSQDESTSEDTHKQHQGEDEYSACGLHDLEGVCVHGLYRDTMGTDALPQLLGAESDTAHRQHEVHSNVGIRSSTHTVYAQWSAASVCSRLAVYDNHQCHVLGGSEARNLPDTGEERAEVGSPQGFLQSTRLAVSSPDGEATLLRIARIEFLGDREVYDLCVEDLHNYVANGVVVHNCNFMPVIQNSRKKRGTDLLDVAADLVEATVRRMKSRFMQGTDQLPMCRMVLDSSRQYPDDFVERRIMEAKHGKIGHKSAVISRSIWEAKAGVRNAAGELYFSGKTFPVEVGNEQRFSRLLTEEEAVFAKGEIVRVAEELRVEFQRDIEGALRDFGGRAVLSLKPLIPNREAISECIRTEESGWAEFTTCHPFSAPSTSFKDNVILLEKILGDLEKHIARVNPDIPRTVHVDFGLTGDCLGFAMGHIEEMVLISRSTEGQSLDLPCTPCRGETVVDCPRCGGTGKMTHWKQVVQCSVCRGTKRLGCQSCKGTGKHGVSIERPRVYIDLMLQVIPPDDGTQIQFDDIEALLVRLRALGFKIPVVTADGYESAQFLQRQVNDYGALIAEELSMDKKKEPYYALRNAVQDKCSKGRRRISFYEYTPFLQEISRVEDRPQKVDHPYKGSKDVSDAVAGVVFNCERIPQLQLPIEGSSIAVHRF